MAWAQAGTLLAHRCPTTPLICQPRTLSAAGTKVLRARRASLHVRSAASAPSADSTEAASEAAPGVKARLLKLLGPAADPVTAEDLWAQASGEGLKSKHFMKSMLNDLRKAGKITSKPARGKSFGYIMPDRWEALKKAAGKSKLTEANPKSRAAI